MSCRTGPLRVGGAFARLFNLSGWIEPHWSSRWSESLFSDQREDQCHFPVKTGIHATKWPPSAQEARPAGLLPLNRPWRLRGNVVHHTIDPPDLTHDPARDRP